ncbi:hypothetical protein [Deinococcus marmoris]|uniref:hypothetical protein n=1 Tax=Deinococcus marmoris TaxID=249408 RepID=UPI0012DF59DB|nr:hypothetical protein [Deinococcus marmoris]
MKRIFFILGVGLVACAPAATSPTAPLPIRAGQLWEYTATPEGQPPITGTISIKTVKFTTPIDAPKDDSSALMVGEVTRGATLHYFSTSRTMQLSLYSALNQETGRCKFVFADKNQRAAISDYHADWKTLRSAGTCEIRLLN